ncbi:hypothetical protein BC939DRAFT_445096 [Gamsiella multidivaricata]|uniref:uncharacterized protein n=1 Tax=Gamsiella multidivaricata TaxID=101098 RepID=UPI00221F05AA|nr:uncharacterized protein BC939DRAFT_445096 [Gamsiella multidivaricata]KAI7827398.1 hypothetical protein BC939DRAFT_445096 [Gamsiella multidivaricata]
MKGLFALKVTQHQMQSVLVLLSFLVANTNGPCVAIHLFIRKGRGTMPRTLYHNLLLREEGHHRHERNPTGHTLPCPVLFIPHEQHLTGQGIAGSSEKAREPSSQSDSIVACSSTHSLQGTGAQTSFACTSLFCFPSMLQLSMSILNPQRRALCCLNSLVRYASYTAAHHHS